MSAPTTTTKRQAIAEVAWAKALRGIVADTDHFALRATVALWPQVREARRDELGALFDECTHLSPEGAAHAIDDALWAAIHRHEKLARRESWPVDDPPPIAHVRALARLLEMLECATAAGAVETDDVA